MSKKIKSKKPRKTDFKKFCKLWVKANKAYKKCFGNDNYHLQFPEPALKKIIKEKYNLTSEDSGSYDFDDNIELKSVTIANGNIPFQFSENECEKIYYCEILDGIINVYRLGETQVKQINEKTNEKINKCKENGINKSSLNINMKDYKGTKPDAKYYLNKGVWKDKS